MYIYEVEGFRRYEGEYQGKKYGGYILHCTYTKPGVEGRAVTEIKIKDRHGYHPRVGDTIHVNYGPNGIDSVSCD